MADREVATNKRSERAKPQVVCRRLSSSSESGFNSDMSDDRNASPSSATDEAVKTLNGLVRDQPNYPAGYQCRE